MRYNIENVLIHQKDEIIGLINNERFDEAKTCLDFVAPLWFAADYGYKYKEIVSRWNMAVKDKIIAADHHKTREKWERVLENAIWKTPVVV